MYYLLLSMLVGAAPLCAMHLHPFNTFCKERYVDPQYPEMGLANFHEIACAEKIDTRAMHPCCHVFLEQLNQKEQPMQASHPIAPPQRRQTRMRSTKKFYLACPYAPNECSYAKRNSFKDDTDKKYAHTLVIDGMRHHIKNVHNVRFNLKKYATENIKIMHHIIQYSRRCPEK